MWKYALAFLALTSGVGQLMAQTSKPDESIDQQERVMKAAVARVSPCVVQIETSGGSDVLGMTPRGPTLRKGTGPTTGVIVSPDGYIISSAFNFANKPSAIFVAIPGHKERLVAKVVATDQSRMLTLLKAEAKGLPVPEATPRKEIQVGQWTMALGRTWAGQDSYPSVSVGIVSATDRIWGKAIQTDAKVSPVNYGGPLVDLAGRVMGILVPASPRGQDETAGVEWYDSGIGFAIPLEDINAVLPRLKKGKDLKRGLLGITLQSPDIYSAVPVIQGLSPDSAAQRAGIKVGDRISEINGKRIVRQAQILHALGGSYEGDVVSVKVLRDKKEIAFPKITLAASGSSFIHPFLGILPLRDDPELGEEVRYVFPKSPAELAGIKPGDRIMKFGMQETPMIPFSGRDELNRVLDSAPPGTELRLEIVRKDSKKTETLKVVLGTLSEEVPDGIPETSSKKQALVPRKQARPPIPGMPIDPDMPGQPKGQRPKLERPKDEKPAATPKKDDKKAETGLIKRSTEAGDHQYWLFAPNDYDPNISYALVIWLHPAGKAKDKDRETEQIIANWEDFCSANHMILLCPKAESETGWIASDADFVTHAVRTVQGEYTIDPQRIVAHGMGVGGQFAFYLGLTARDLIRGVVTTSAALNNQPKEDRGSQRLAFFIVAGGKDPLLDAIVESKNKLVEFKLPVVYREIPEMGHEYLDAVTLHDVILWIDSLDRQ